MIKLGTKCDFMDDTGITDDEKYGILAQMGFHSVDYSFQFDYRNPLFQLSDEELKKDDECRFPALVVFFV